jgi:hypothetical protein
LGFPVEMLARVTRIICRRPLESVNFLSINAPSLALHVDAFGRELRRGDVRERIQPDSRLRADQSRPAGQRAPKKRAPSHPNARPRDPGRAAFPHPFQGSGPGS